MTKEFDKLCYYRILYGLDNFDHNDPHMFEKLDNTFASSIGNYQDWEQYLKNKLCVNYARPINYLNVSCYNDDFHIFLEIVT